MKLIDADALILKLNEEGIPYNADINDVIRKAPTVCPNCGADMRPTERRTDCNGKD